MKSDFNSDWEFVKCDAEWPDEFAAATHGMAPVHLPHTWNADDMLPGGTDPYVGPGCAIRDR